MARREGRPDPKETALAAARCLNPHPEQVRDPEFLSSEFFDARDVVQVKYEMVRKVKAEGAPVTAAAAAFGYSRPSYYEAAARAGAFRAGGTGAGPARAARRAQAHRADPRLGREPAGRRPGAAPGAAAGPDRAGLRRARAPPHGRARAGPPPGAPLQKPLTCPPARCGRRSTRPCPRDPHLAVRLLNRAPARMLARSPPPAAGWMPATSNCVMPPCTRAPRRSRSGSACSPAAASPPGGTPWPAWPPPDRARRRRPPGRPAPPRPGRRAPGPGGRRAHQRPGGRRARRRRPVPVTGCSSVRRSRCSPIPRRRR